MAGTEIILDFTWLEIKISMQASKIENRFQTGFQQPKSGLQKTDINIPKINQI